MQPFQTDSICVTIIQSSILLHNEINSHLFFVVGNSGELWLEELSDLFSCDMWLLSGVLWVLGDTSRLQERI